jgi:hypothetical protein
LERWLFKKDGVRITMEFLRSDECRSLLEEIVAGVPDFSRKAATAIKEDPRLETLRALIVGTGRPSQTS